MNQQCKVCGEPAAGFHFGAFTCEGCKSFFGRSYNNINTIMECKNGGNCIINKKNRTSCKACRLKKCLYVGMSKSGSRYGRRSNWFKIHCLLQEQQQQQQLQQQQPQQELQQLQQQVQQQVQQQQQQQQQQSQHHYQPNIPNSQQLQRRPTSPSVGVHGNQRKDEVYLMLGPDEYKNSSSPSISSPESDNSVDVSEKRGVSAGHPGFRAPPPHIPHLLPDLSSLSKEMLNMPLGFPLGGIPLLPPALLPPPNLSMFSPYHFYTTQGTHHPFIAHQASAGMQHSPVSIDENGSSALNARTCTATSTTTTISTSSADGKDRCENEDDDNDNNNDRSTLSHNVTQNESPAIEENHEENHDKRFFLDVVLKSQRTLKRSPTPIYSRPSPEYSPFYRKNFGPLPYQDNPMDLSKKNTVACVDEHPEDKDDVSDEEHSSQSRPAPMDLTTKL